MLSVQFPILPPPNKLSLCTRPPISPLFHASALLYLSVRFFLFPHFLQCRNTCRVFVLCPFFSSSSLGRESVVLSLWSDPLSPPPPHPLILLLVHSPPYRNEIWRDIYFLWRVDFYVLSCAIFLHKVPLFIVFWGCSSFTPSTAPGSWGVVNCER